MSTYATQLARLEAAKNLDASSVTIEVDEGEVTVPVEAAIEHFHMYIAPGEGFDVLSINFDNLI